jgi:hypothetical protein
MVQAKHDQAVSFETLQTYTWQPVAGRLGMGVTNDSALDSRIRSAVDKELQSKGYRLVQNTERPDFLLDYQASADEKVDATYLKNYATAEFMGLTYTVGTLALNIQKSSSATVGWQGAVQVNVDRTKPLAERNAKLADAVHALLKKFPSSKAK